MPQSRLATRPRVVGVVPLEGRDGLPFVELHREALFLHSVRALLDVEPLGGRVVVTVEAAQRPHAEAGLAAAGLEAVVEDPGAWWQAVARPDAGAGRPVVLVHDPLCPLVPAAFLADCLTASRGEALVAFRPVTDTLKTVVDDHIADTLDRDRFGIVASPLVFTGPSEDLTAPPTHDFAAMALWLRAHGPVTLRKAPSLGRRVDDPSAVNLLECMDEMARTVRER